MYRGLYRNARGWGRRNPVLYDLPLTSIADPRDLANINGLGGIYGVPDFLWVAGDGNTPTIGPTLSVTGTPSSVVSPWQLSDGADVASEVYTGTSYRKTSTVVDPTIGQDIIVSALVKKPSAFAGTSAIISTRTSLGGVTVRFQGDLAVVFVHDNVTLITPLISATNAAYIVLQAVIDGDGNTYIISNGIANAPTATPAAGVLGSGAGVGVGGYPDGFAPMGAGGAIIFASVEYGNGIADAWIADSFARCVDFANRFSGLHPLVGGTTAFTRASGASWADRNGIWRIASSGLPRSGDENGFRAALARTNKIYNTINPQATTGWSTTGGTHTVPSDESQLSTDGLREFGPNVHQFVPGGSDQIIYGGATTANTNKHSSSLFIRGSAGGESVDVGVRDSSSGVFTNHQTVVLTTSWQRVQIDGWTPGDTDEQFALDCDAGDTILFIAPQMEEGVVGTSPIPNFATAASATRAQDVLTIPNTPSDTEGSIALFVTPDNWNAADLTGLSPDILSRATVASTILYATTAGYNSDDGTTVITAGSPADGVEDQIRCRWRGTKQSLQVGTPKVSGDYDGSQSGSGTWAIKPTDVEFRVRNLKIYQKGY